MKNHIRHNAGDYININGWYYLIYSRAMGLIHAVWRGYPPAPLMRGLNGKEGICSIPSVPIGWGDGGPALVPSTWRLKPDSSRIIF